MTNPPCTNCNGNILNQSNSLIPTPLCVGDCPQNVACTDVLSSDCVYYNGQNIPCISTPITGQSLTTVLGLIGNSLGVKVSSSDACCGYLNTKIVSGNPALLSVSTRTVSGCQVLVLTPSGVQTPPCSAKVSANGTDGCDYLINKVESSDSSLSITYDGGTGAVDFTAPCAGKVLVDNVTNFQDTCDVLASKFTQGDVTVIMTNGNSAQDQILNASASTSSPKIKITRLVKTFQWDGGSDSANDPIRLDGAYNTIATGTVQRKNFNVVNNSFPSGLDPVYDQTSGAFTMQMDGVYDVSVFVAFGSKSGGSLVAFNSVNALFYGLMGATHNCASNCFSLVSSTASVSTSQNIVYDTAFVKGVSMRSGTDVINPTGGHKPYFLLYILNLIARMENNGTEFVINISFEKTSS